MRVRYLTPAREEFLAALEFYETEAPGLGAEFDAEVQELESRLRSHPRSGAPYSGDTRRALLRSFPFSMIYEVLPNEILAVAIAHQRRRPDYIGEAGWADGTAKSPMDSPGCQRLVRQLT